MPHFCPNCGAAITDKVKFCPECGGNINSFLEKPIESPQEISETAQTPVKVKPSDIAGGSNEYKKLKDVSISVICSFFIPGLGQIYNGNTTKGVGIGFLLFVLLFFSPPLAFIIWLIGLIDAYYDAEKINQGKIPFRAPDHGDMIIYAILGIICIAAVFPALNSSMSTTATSPSSSLLATGDRVHAIPETQEQRNIRVVKDIAAEYHRTHTYYGKDIYVCGDMASDVWNMLKTQGINAKIQIGNVDAPIEKIFDANHAWVLAEVAPDTWLAVEPTAGTLVYKTENPLYYRGHSFYTPKQFKDYSVLLKQYNDAVSKYKSAQADYNNLVDEYNAAGVLTKISLNDDLEAKKIVLNERTRDLNGVTQQINALLESS